MSDNLTNIPIELLRKYDRPGPRYTSYPTVPVWKDDVGNEQYKQALKDASTRTDEPFAIYCHIPFCEKRCYYCGCNTFITRRAERVENYLDTICLEVAKTSALLGKRKKVSQLHFGGGTPTFLTNDQLTKFLDTLDNHFEFIEGCEKSIEVDPRVTTDSQLELLTSRGFNRISLGVQDFDTEVQEAIGRKQPYETVTELLNKCRKLNFKGINFDLIYGLPKQTLENFTITIDKVIELRPDRIALYSFAYLPQMKAHQSKIDEEDLPITELKYKLFAKAVELLTKAGYRQIGMDHFALPEDELAKAQLDGRLHRNFMGYTVQSSPEMIGIGMSSIGYINNSFFQNHPALDKYMETVADDGFAVSKGKLLNDDDLIRQYTINSLMCNFILYFDKFKEKFGKSYHEYFKTEHDNLSEFSEDKFLELTDQYLAISKIGRTFIRNIAMTYDAYLHKEKNGKKATFSKTI